MTQARPEGHPEGHPDEQDHGGARRRRLAAAAWVCAVGAAFLLGAWSFSHADPGGQYGRPEPLGDGAVQHELSQERAKANQPASLPDGDDDKPSSSPPPSSSPAKPAKEKTPRARTATVRFPGGLGTAVAECDRGRGARTVKLLSWSPSEGYSVDDVDPGPAARASLELEPLADDADDHTVVVRCADGKPHTAYEGDDGDDD